MSAPSTALAITRAETASGARLSATLPPGAAGQWCRLRLDLPPGQAWWAKLELTDRARGQVVREAFLGPMRAGAWRETLVHVPRAARDVTIVVFGAGAAQAALRLEPLARPRAAWRLLRHGWRGIPAALGGSPLGAAGRLRAVLGQAPARAGQAPPYADWIAWFETAPDQAACHDASAWDVRIVIVAGAPQATEASLRAARAQIPAAPPIHLVTSQADWAAIPQGWVILLQAGEILAPAALVRFAQAARAAPWAECLTADCDSLDHAGTRHDPVFTPGPDPLLLACGLPVRGACALRWRNIPDPLPLNGQAARHSLAARVPGRIAHIPGLLSHIRVDTEHPARRTVPVADPPGYPTVTILVPSALRAAHVVKCLSRVARATDYPALNVKLVLSDPARARSKILRAVARLPRVSILPVDNTPFNYARANNLAAAGTDSELLLLLNDDVAPVGTQWLARMVAHMRDPSVGIVGARLLYGNGMVQHEGVIMGLANLCEHAGRLRPGADPGPHGIGMLDRQVAAVTAACLLIRASLYRELGGMDEAYAVALNDVDLCLRARHAGCRVVYCAGATLHHYESLSLGRHYAGGRAALEAAEVQRLRHRFGAVIAADPFYSPLASLQPGREWQPAFPPRAHPHAVGSAPHPPNPPAAGWKKS
jgi:GT2 family glycosyltransferase